MVRLAMSFQQRTSGQPGNVNHFSVAKTGWSVFGQRISSVCGGILSAASKSKSIFCFSWLKD
jgi:hypothetical protein